MENRWHFTIGRNNNDPEKKILPTILFINTNHPVFTDARGEGFIIMLSWWDFSIKIGVFLKNK